MDGENAIVNGLETNNVCDGIITENGSIKE